MFCISLCLYVFSLLVVLVKLSVLGLSGERLLCGCLVMVRRLSPHSPGQRALMTFGSVYCFIMCVFFPAVNNILHTPIAKCSQCVLKVPLNSNQPMNLSVLAKWLVRKTSLRTPFNPDYLFKAQAVEHFCVFCVNLVSLLKTCPCHLNLHFHLCCLQHYFIFAFLWPRFTPMQHTALHACSINLPTELQGDILSSQDGY